MTYTDDQLERRNRDRTPPIDCTVYKMTKTHVYLMADDGQRHRVPRANGLPWYIGLRMKNVRFRTSDTPTNPAR